MNTHESIKGSYLLRAYTQDHFVEKESFLNFLRSEFDENEVFELHKRFLNKYGLPKLGTSRATYISESFVFKLPVSLDGFRLNDREGSLCAIGEEGKCGYIPIAKSRLIDIDGIPIVVMEKVKESYPDDIKSRLGHVPEFVLSVDMQQVGFNRKGNLVAFDYADL